MITHFINWVKGLFSKKEEPIILEEIKEEKKTRSGYTL